MSEEPLNTRQRQQRRAREASRQLNENGDESPSRRRTPAPRPETPTPRSVAVERTRAASRRSRRESQENELQHSPRRRRTFTTQDENFPNISGDTGSQECVIHANRRPLAPIPSYLLPTPPSTQMALSANQQLISPRQQVQLPPSRRAAAQRRRQQQARGGNRAVADVQVPSQTSVEHSVIPPTPPTTQEASSTRDQHGYGRQPRVRLPPQVTASTPVSRAGRTLNARVLDARAASGRQSQSPQPSEREDEPVVNEVVPITRPVALQRTTMSLRNEQGSTRPSIIHAGAIDNSSPDRVSGNMEEDGHGHGERAVHSGHDGGTNLNNVQMNENNEGFGNILQEEPHNVNDPPALEEYDSEDEEAEHPIVVPVVVQPTQGQQAHSRRHRRRRHEDLFCIARKPYQEPAERHYFGRMDIPCLNCGALHWLAEKLSASSMTNPKFGTCCSEGRVRLPASEAPPEPLLSFFTGNDQDSKSFREDIWKYNRALAFTSLGVTEDHSVNRGRGQPVFRVCGELCHKSGALVPSGDNPPRYAQLYIYEPRAALESRMTQNQGLSRNIMQGLQDMLLQHHQYAPIFKHAHEIIRDYNGPIEDAEVRLRVAPGLDRRRYNLPTADEVAVILPGSQSKAPRDIILRNRDGPLYRISDLHPAYAPLQYPLLFPRGENGWHPDMVLHESVCQRDNRLRQAQQRQERRNQRGLHNSQPTRETRESRRLTLSRYVSFRIHSRPGEYNVLLHGGRLLTRYMVDMFACIDQSRLRFLEDNQPRIRAAHFSGLEDAMADDGDTADLHELGQHIILPSSYIGGPRHMTQRFQDAMAIARYFRKVDIFLTMTTNPAWKEIVDELLPGQTTYDRPDLVARVFELKKDTLIEYIYKHGVFGRAVAYVYTIEFQKRGLPHIHLLIFLKEPYKLITPEAIDSCIWARWPDPITQPLLFETVKRLVLPKFGSVRFRPPFA